MDRLDELEDLVAGIATTIQRVYGDATQTALDRKAAAEIWRYLQERGVMPLSTAAALIEAAGGEIVVPERVLIDPPDEVARSEEWADGSVRYRTRRSAPGVIRRTAA